MKESARKFRGANSPHKRSLWGIVCLLAASVGMAAAVGCSGLEGPTPISVKTPAPEPSPSARHGDGSPTYLAGQELFNKNCSQCHGAEAAGSDLGPPLVHELYLPYHHPDFSFHAAVNKGVKMHHWFFGDMPPIPGVTDEEVGRIICYVRTLQRDSGTQTAPAC